jgi:hypothetical protein
MAFTLNSDNLGYLESFDNLNCTMRIKRMVKDPAFPMYAQAERQEDWDVTILKVLKHIDVTVFKPCISIFFKANWMSKNIEGRVILDEEDFPDKEKDKIKQYIIEHS